MRAAALALMVLLPALLPVLLPAGALAQSGGGEVPRQLSEVRIEQRMGAQVPADVALRDETGAAVRMGRFFDGKPTVLVLAYIRCPRLCSVVLSNLVESLKDVPFTAGKDFNLVVVSFDPREGPDLAAAARETYVERYGRPGAAEGIHFLTGEEKSVRQVADSVGFRYVYDRDRDEYRHGSGIMLLTPEGKVARYLFGIGFSSRDLRLGLVEASEGQIGSAVDDVLLLTCLSYDPESGRYSIAVMKLVRLGGAVTVAGIVMYLGLTWLRERRRARSAAGQGPG